MLIELDPRDPRFEDLEAGVHFVIDEPLKKEVTSVVLCGEMDIHSKYYGFVALYVDASDFNRTHHFSITWGGSSETESLSELIIKGGCLIKLVEFPQNPVKQEDMLHLSVNEHIPYAVLLVGRSGKRRNDPLLKLNFLQGFDPIRIFGCIYQSVISKSAELN